MLQPECTGCVNEETCRYLALANCAQCPLVLTCPATQLVEGFNTCIEPEKIANTLLPICRLPTKFFRVEAAPEPRTIYCGRCGSRALSSYSCTLAYLDEDLGIFGEQTAERSADIVCAICNLNARVAGETPLKTGAVHDHTVFVLA